MVGMFATLAQVVFMREMLSVFYGNELCIGLILSGWFVGIAVGALFARLFLGRKSTEGAAILVRLKVVVLSAGLLFLVQVCLVRLIKVLTGVPEGEYASPLTIAISAFLLCLPSSFAVGYFFPLACHHVSSSCKDGGRYAGTVYFWESAGSMLAGLLASLLLVVYMNPFQMAAVTTVTALLAALFLMADCRTRSILLALTLTAVFGLSLDTRLGRSVDRSFEKLRFAKTLNAGSGSRLVRAASTPYQSLAIIEYAGQNTLYGNGHVLFVFPDRNSAEHKIHFLLAQNPGAKKILMLGGDPLDDIPEILKYKCMDVTYVEQDGAIASLMQAGMPKVHKQVFRNDKVRIIDGDPFLYVHSTKDRYDVVIVNAPEPSTVSASRFYSVEFYRALKGVMASSGFVYTLVRSSERLQPDAANMSGSVYKALKSVFPRVLVTAGENNRFFASDEASLLSFRPDLLSIRSASADIRTEYFRPEYFAATDEIDSAKVAEVEKKLCESEVAANSLMKPSSSFYSMNLWLNYSGSSLGVLAKKLESSNPRVFQKSVVAMGLGILILAALLRRRLSAKIQASVYMAVLGLTGFCTIAIEILLVYVFQSFHGTVYSKIGIIVSAFMLGLMLGSAAGKVCSSRTRTLALVGLVLSELILMAVSVSAGVVSGGWSAPGFMQSEIGIYLLTCLAGFAGGVQFPVICMLMDSKGKKEGVSSANVVWSDNIGAAAGALVAGVLLVPVLGIGQTVIILVTLNILGLLLTAAGALGRPE